MTLKIKSIKKDGFLYIQSEGRQETPEDHEAHILNLYHQIQEYNFEKILIDETRVTFNPNFFQLYSLVQFTGNLPDKVRLYTIASVIEKRYTEYAEFWETISVNRGFDFQVFYDIKSAEDWLKSE